MPWLDNGMSITLCLLAIVSLAHAVGKTSAASFENCELYCTEGCAPESRQFLYCTQVPPISKIDWPVTNFTLSSPSILLVPGDLTGLSVDNLYVPSVVLLTVPYQALQYDRRPWYV